MEKYKQLNIQAMFAVVNGNDPDGDANRMYIPSEYVKKFAELVIAECAASYHQTRPAGEPIETFFRKHLGVEQ